MCKKILEAKGVSHHFGNNGDRKDILHNINLEVKAGQVVGLVGTSGCGKSTLLRGLVGTHPPRSGEIKVFSENSPEGSTIKEPSRKIGIVYQRYSLFPNLTAVKNVALGLMLDQTSLPFRFFRPLKWRKLRKEHLQKAESILIDVGLEEAINLYPTEMSGGMRQRVAIAQALIMEPEIMLLDEPFASVDAVTRKELQDMLLRLYEKNVEAKKMKKRPPYTIVMVTHEIDEAIFVGDRVVALSRYWNWKESHKKCPGATIVYDKPAPVFRAGDPRDYAAFVEQKNEIIHSAITPDG